MSITLTAANLQAALGALSDAATAYRSGFSNVAADEVVVFDAVDFIAPLIGGPFGLLAPVLGPALVDGAVWVVENNESDTPGSLTRIASGNRGSAAQSEQQPEAEE